MTNHPHRLNLLWVAAMALAGILSVGDTARACAETKVPKACCEGSPAADCQCCGMPNSASLSGVARAHGTGWTSALGVEGLRPGGSCECRSNDPVAPAQKPESRTSDESRTDQGNDAVVAYLTHAPQPSMPASRLISANLSPPKSPLYLRTLHLLV